MSSKNPLNLKQDDREVIFNDYHFRLLMEQSPFPIELLTPDGKIAKVNNAYKQLWNITEEEVVELKKNYNILEDKQIEELGIMPLVKRAFKGEYIVVPVIKYSSKETFEEIGLPAGSTKQTPVWIQCHIYSMRSGEGDITHVVITYVDLTETKNTELKLREAVEEIDRLNKILESEVDYLQEEIKLDHNFENIVGESEALNYVLNRVQQVAATELPVLILGETGTGKELIARAIHKLSSRSSKPLVKVNCAALSKDLIESELFGHEKGAFTGAVSSRKGRFEVADNSTLFLDEIGELSPETQSKLLQIIETGEYERLGSSTTRKSNVRIIAATNRVLEEEVEHGNFREDLWHRLKVFQITVPPLRERPEDIPILVKWFLDELSKKIGKKFSEIPENTLQMLTSYPWPGNVRELKNIVDNAAITAKSKRLNFDLPKISPGKKNELKTFEEMEREYLIKVLKAKNWKIGGENSASSVLGMHVNTLRSRMEKLQIKKPKPE